MPDPRGHRRYREWRARVRQAHAAQQRPCDLCGRAIDYALQHPDQQAWTLEHPDALADGGQLMPADPGAAHQDCQNRQGGQIRQRIRRLGATTRGW